MEVVAGVVGGGGVGALRQRLGAAMVLIPGLWEAGGGRLGAAGAGSRRQGWAGLQIVNRVRTI